MLRRVVKFPLRLLRRLLRGSPPQAAREPTPAAPEPVAAPSASVPPPAPPRQVEVWGEATPNPNAMKFACSVQVLDKGSRSWAGPDEAAGHPLAAACFAVSGVRGVFAVRDFVTVTKAQEASWTDLEPRLQRAIADALARA